MKLPWTLRRAPDRGGIAILTFGDANELGFAVAGQVGKGGRFVIRLIETLVSLPMAFSAFGIFEPRSVLAGKADDQNVVPAILVEVISPGEKIIRVGVLGAERALEAGHLHRGHGAQLEIERRLGRRVFVALL